MTRGPTIPRSARVAATPDVVSARVGDDFALLHLGRSLYHGIQGVGARVWEMVSDEGSRVSDIEATLLREYDVEPDVLGRDLDVLLRALLERGLVEMTDDPPPSRDDPE